MRQLLLLPPRDPAITMSQLRFWLQFATIGKVILLLLGAQGRRGGGVAQRNGGWGGWGGVGRPVGTTRVGVGRRLRPALLAARVIPLEFSEQSHVGCGDSQGG